MLQLLLVLGLELAGFALLIGLLKAEAVPVVLGFLAVFLAGGLAFALWAPVKRQVRSAFMTWRIPAVGVIFALAAFLPFLFRTNPYWLFSLALGGLLLIVALGLNVQIGSAGLSNLCGAAFYGTGAYTAALLATRMGAPAYVTLLAGLLVSVALGGLLFIPVLKVKGHYLALVTIAFGVAFNILLNNTEQVGGPQGIKNVPGLSFFGINFNAHFRMMGQTYHYYTKYYWFVLALVALAVIVAGALYQSPAGLVFNSLRDDEISARTVGINPAAWKLIAFSAGNAFIGLAGATYAHMIGYVAPASFTFSDSLYMLSMVVLGGLDSVPGVSLAVMLLVLIMEKLRILQDYRFFLYGLLVLAMLLFRPQGLVPFGIRGFGLDRRRTPARGAGVKEEGAA